ncbi:MAG: CoA transferase [Chloroflexi bacterium]|nr:CoA transferase [Chloroflexota bacterium]
MAGVLEGIRVLDWTVFQQGPVASMILGDLGADVIKIESPGGGDPGRGMIRVAGAMVGGREVQRNPYFEAGNRNKRSITLELKSKEAREIVYKLVEKSDVFIQNFRMGVAERMGMDYETLRKRNPRLIYAHASGWGPKGPDKDDPSADYTALARSGFMMMAGEPGSDPIPVQGGLADQTGAVMTAFGVMSALYARERTGRGQKVDASILGSMSFIFGHPIVFCTMANLWGFKIARSSAGNPLWNHYKCADDKWVAMAHLSPDKFWPALCRAMGLEHLEKDPRFDSMDSRMKNCRELIGILDSTFATKNRDEWVKRFKLHGLVFSPMNNMLELTQDPQVLANDYIKVFDHPVFGPIKTVGFPLGFSQTPCSIRREAPELGQHTEEILTELLGYSWDEIGKLKEDGAI